MKLMAEERKGRIVLRFDKNGETIRPEALLAFLAVVCWPLNTVTFGGVGILLLVCAPMLLLCAPTLMARLQNPLWDRGTILLSVFFAYGLIGYLWTPDFRPYSLYNYVKIVMVVMCLYCQSYNKREKKLLFIGAIIACLIVCSFLLTGNSIGYEDGRATLAVSGVMQDQNYLGFFFIVPLALAVNQILCNKSIGVKMISLAFALVLLYCVLTTGSRGALVGLAVVVLVLVFKQFKTLHAKIVFCFAMILLVLALFHVVLVFLPEHIIARFSFQSLLHSRGTGRGDIWLQALNVIWNSPMHWLFGFGTSSSIELLGVATHNYILQLMLELGIVGVILFLWFYWTWFKRLWKMDSLCLSIILGCMALAMTLSVNTSFYFWIPLILGIVCSKRENVELEAHKNEDSGNVYLHR